MNKVLCIAGMHRSGTSLTASWLERCGLAIHDGEIHGPATGNPKGHFEDKEFVALHANAIKAQEPRSAGWKIGVDSEISMSQELVDAARRIIEHRNRKFAVWGWKDPRSVFFLEQWRNLIPDLKVLLVWRSCSLVTSSLLRRSDEAKNPVFKLTVDEAKSLWLAYNELIRAHKRANPDKTLLVPLEHIIQDDRSVHSAISEHLGIRLTYQHLSSVFDAALMYKTKTLDISCPKTAFLERSLEALSDI